MRLTNRKVPLEERSSVPLASFFRTAADGGKLIVWHHTVTFCPSRTTCDGRTRTVVFLGGAGTQDTETGHMTHIEAIFAAEPVVPLLTSSGSTGSCLLATTVNHPNQRTHFDLTQSHSFQK